MPNLMFFLHCTACILSFLPIFAVCCKNTDMSNLLSKIGDVIRKHPYEMLLTLFVLWTCIGVFPLQCYETDGLEILLGCDVMYQNGWTLPPVYSYEYRMQPLTTIIVVGLKYLLPFLTCEQIYSLMTALFSLGFLLGCISLAKHVTKESKIAILVAAMLLPEMYAIAMYANTAIPSAALVVWACLLITRQRYWLSVVLLVVALLFRLDSIIVYPVILPLFYYEGKSLKQSLILSAVFAVAVVALTLPLFWLVGADVLTTYFAYERWSEIITLDQTLTAIFGFYSLSYVVLLPLGLYVISSKMRWRELFLVLLPILTVHIFYAEMGNASKHFLYCAPFAIIVGTRALVWLVQVVRVRPILKWVTLIVFVLYMTISIRPNRQDCSWVYNSELYNVGVAVPLSSVEVAGKSRLVGIGAGRQLITGDEFMLVTGHLFYSWYLHSIKAYIEQWRKEQKEVLDHAGTCNVLTFEWGISAAPAFELLSEGGYHFHRLENMPKWYRFTISDEGRDVHFWRVFLSAEETAAPYVSVWLKSFVKMTGKEDCYAIAAPDHYGVWHVLDELSETGKVEKVGGKIFKVVK